MCQIRPLHMGTLESLVKLVKWGVIDVISSSVGSQFIGMVAILYGFLVCVCVCVFSWSHVLQVTNWTVNKLLKKGGKKDKKTCDEQSDLWTRDQAWM